MDKITTPQTTSQTKQPNSKAWYRRWQFYGGSLAACFVVFTFCLSSLAGCTGSTPSPAVTPTTVVPSATPVPTAVSTLAATATPKRKGRIPLWDSGYWYLLGVNVGIV